MTADRLLLVTHVHLRNVRGHLSIDDQTALGLIRWSESFEQVTYAGVEAPEDDAAVIASTHWVPIADLPCADRLNVIAMPHAYKADRFIRAYKTTRAMLAEEIARSKYPCFTLGTLVGDWGAIAGLEAIKQQRDYAVWFDRVDHEVIRSKLSQMPIKRRIKEALSIPLMQHYHRYLIRRSQLGLFQGKDCYDHYSRFTDKGFCVYDTHTKPSDFIDASALERKLAGVGAGEGLRICYVGRADDMKGPLDWIATLAKVRAVGVPFKATWIGDGPLLQEMRDAVAGASLTECVDLPGFSADRAGVLGAVKQAHVFLFCHKTPESPRCLIESLVCGTAIIGYSSAYARDLVAIGGGGEFVEVSDVSGLADRLIALNADREALAGLIKTAAQSGLRFDEQKVYRERADLIRTHV